MVIGCKKSKSSIVQILKLLSSLGVGGIFYLIEFTYGQMTRRSAMIHNSKVNIIRLSDILN